jgi:hypothetical protein
VILKGLWFSVLLIAHRSIVQLRWSKYLAINSEHTMLDTGIENKY